MASRAQANSSYEESVQQAVLEYNVGNFEEAQALFRHAHSMDPNARTWRGLGICAFELRLYVEATSDLEAALADPRKPLTAAQQAETRLLLEKARAFVSSYHVRTVPANAHVEVDGKPAELHDETLHLDPGPHVLVTSAPGYLEQRTELRTGAGLREELRIDLVASTQENAQERALPTPVSTSPEHPGQPMARRRRIWTWSLAAGAVAASAVAIGSRLRADGVHREFDDCSSHGADCGALSQRGQNLLLGAHVSGAAAGGLALGAVIAFFLERSKPASDQSTTVLLGPKSVQIRGTF